MLSLAAVVAQAGAAKTGKTKPAPAAAGDMVKIPAGPFLMGCNAAVDTQCFDSEPPGQQVEVPAFMIDRTEVTVQQYRRCVQAGTCSTSGLTMPFWKDAEQPEWAKFCNWDQPGHDRHPINCLDWFQAKAYCEWAGKRLPSEIEWEKAARGTDGRKYPWGNEGFAAGKKLANIADESARHDYPKWTIEKGYDDGFLGTAPVGSFPAGASPYGALDMIGNVWEWLSDDNPGGRSVRGGSSSSPSYVRVSTRSWYDPKGRYERIGVRCAR